MPFLNLPMGICLVLWQHTLVWMDTPWLEKAQLHVLTRAAGVIRSLFASVSQINRILCAVLVDEDAASIM